MTSRRGEVVDDVARVRQRAGEPVELGDHERVAGAAGGERFAQAGPVAVGAGQAVVDVDALGGYAERLQAVALGGEVLRVGGDARVADQQPGHAAKCVPYVGRSPGISAGGSYGTAARAATLARRPPGGCPGGGSAYGTSDGRALPPLPLRIDATAAGPTLEGCGRRSRQRSGTAVRLRNGRRRRLALEVWPMPSGCAYRHPVSID